ncbi:MAG: SDR family oxidoreductase [Halococcoides sp.]
METVLITGAASGIGRATAMRFHDAGWTVYATDVETDGLDDLGCNSARMDVTDSDEIEGVVEQIVAEAGSIDCLVNTAGYAQLGPVEDVTIERMQAQFDVNVWGVIRCIQAVLPRLREQGRGTIVTIGSVQGRVASPGWVAYAASKHALAGFHEAMAAEECGVDVVLVEPAWVETGFADRVAEHLAGVDRTDCYADLYSALDGTELVSGGRLAISPETVARKILSVATAEAPRSRSVVGLPARAVVLTRLHSDLIRTHIQQYMVRRFADRDG